MSVILNRFVSANLQSVGEREFGGNAASPDLQADGYALDLRGGDLSRLQGPAAPLLWQHDVDSMIGRVTSIRATATAVPFRAQFLAAGASEVADKRCRELKGGAPYGASLSFSIDAWEPLVPGRNAGRRATKWTALELSLCAVPVDPKAIVTERARRALGGLKGAMAACDRALDEHRAAGRHQDAMSDSLERLAEHRRQGGTAVRALKNMLEADDQNDEPDNGENGEDQMQDCFGRCQRSIHGMSRELKAIGAGHADALEAHAGLTRALREAEAAMGSTSSQGSAGIDSGTSRSADVDRRRRQAEALKLAAPHDDDFLRRQRALEAIELAAVQS
jgi:hypothetical protein